MKRIKHLILVLICILMLSGCNKEQLTMSIGRDKSMVCNFDFLLEDDYIEESETARNSLTEQATKYQTYGYSVSSKKDNGYSGYTFTKKYNNIDDLSNGNGEEMLLDDFIEGKNLSKTFKVEKGFLRNIYTAKFTFEVSNKTLEGMITTNETTTENNSDVIIDNNEVVPSTQQMAFTNNETYNTNQMDFVYTVVLPYSAIKNNANDTSNGRKILSWKVLGNKVMNIEYSFPIYNLNNVLIVLGVGMVIVIIIIIVLSRLLKKKKANKETLIHTDYDSSIVGKIEETSSEQDAIPQGPANHEFSVPESQAVPTAEVENTTLVSNEVETPQVEIPPMTPVVETNENIINQ